MKETVNSEVLAVTLATKLPAYLDPPVQLTFQHLQVRNYRMIILIYIT